MNRRALAPGAALRHVDAPVLVTAGLLVVAVVVSVALQPTFLTLYSLTSNLATVVPLVLAALAQTVVILAGGLDLSVGAVVALASCTAVQVMGGEPSRLGLGIAVALATGAACGLVNGLVVALVRLQPLIVTFATASVFSGVTLLVLPTPGGTVPSPLTQGYRMAVGPLPVPLLLILGAVLAWWVLGRTRFLRHVYAVGGDAQAAYASLVPVTRVTVLAYTVGGMFAGAAAVAVLANTGSGDPFIGTDIAMNAIAAAVLGGIALSGGRGSGYGAVMGAVILSLTGNILFFLKVPTTLRELCSGLIIIAALTLSVISSWRGESR